MTASIDLYAAAIAHRVRPDQDVVALPMRDGNMVRDLLIGATPTHLLLAHVCISAAVLDLDVKEPSA